MLIAEAQLGEEPGCESDNGNGGGGGDDGDDDDDDGGDGGDARLEMEQ